MGIYCPYSALKGFFENERSTRLTIRLHKQHLVLSGLQAAVGDPSMKTSFPTNLQELLIAGAGIMMKKTYIPRNQAISPLNYRVSVLHLQRSANLAYI